MLAALAFGVAEIAAGLMPTYVLFAVTTPLIGFATITLLNSANATMQLESEPELRGRVMALYMTIVMGGTPLGSPFIGWVGEQFGARWTLIIGGVLVLGGACVAVVVHARMRGGSLGDLSRHVRGRVDAVDPRPVEETAQQGAL